MGIDRLRRREFITALGGAAAAWPLAARAQQAVKVWRIGVLETLPPATNVANLAAFRKGLRDLGYVEGRNLIIEYRSADGRAERFPDLAAELARLKVDVIVTRGTPAVMAAKNVSSTIPVVMAASGEPLAVGAITGLARPGGNVTGFSAITGELEPKRLELLREIAPQIKRIALLYNLSNPVFRPRLEIMRTVTRPLDIELQLLDVRAPEDLGPAFEMAASQHAHAFIVGNDGLIQANRRSIVDLLARYKLPAIFGDGEFVDDGGLISYSVSYPHLYSRAASFVDKIFKGAKPADLPVEQPIRFELIVNLKTAKAIGLPISETFLVRADKVIE